MRIGDKVRFLNQTGGGIVVGFARKGWVTVKDEDDFEFPIPEKECVVIEENVVAKEDVKIQTKDGDKLNIAVVYTKKGKEYICTLANECNYTLFVTYTNCLKEERSSAAPNESFVTTFSGEVLPYERKELFHFGIEHINNYSKRVILRAIPFKPNNMKFKGDVTHKIKPVIEFDYILDPTNLLKESMFRPNDYIKENGYVISVVNETAQNQPIAPEIKGNDIRAALKEKFEGEKAVASQQGSNSQLSGQKDKAFVGGKWVNLPGSGLQREWLQDTALIKINPQGLYEVDLHAGALLDTTIGMDNTAILKYQLEKFNEAMTAILHKKGGKIVFIHGKGDGVLRKALLAELKNKYSRCKWQDASFKEYGYGATMVTIY
ncbi:MAG: DUF2027 domain-containing protein [Bacteroidales bacterium]|nr:DUF2027 domain-containing protein [Bacteroidales bacterium]